MAVMEQLPSINNAPPKAGAKKAEAKPAEVKSEVVQTSIVEIHVPLRYDPSVGYARRRLDVMLTQQQAETAKCIAEALDRASVKLPGGKQVESPTDVVRWILDEVAKKVKELTP